jgi:preprotein translocase SecE subunit
MAKKKVQGTENESAGQASQASSNGKPKLSSGNPSKLQQGQLKVVKGKDSGDSSGKQPTKDTANKEKDKEGSENALLGKFKATLQFLKEVGVERRKISWPEREQVTRETMSVLCLVAAITLLVLSYDWLLGWVFGALEHFARLHGGGIGRG